MAQVLRMGCGGFVDVGVAGGALANGMLAGQKDAAENWGTTGEIPTWGMRRKPINWLNNSYYAAEAVLRLANAVSSK